MTKPKLKLVQYVRRCYKGSEVYRGVTHAFCIERDQTICGKRAAYQTLVGHRWFPAGYTFEPSNHPAVTCVKCLDRLEVYRIRALGQSVVSVRKKTIHTSTFIRRIETK